MSVKQMAQINSSLQQIKNTSLRAQTLEMLRSAILNGELKPGEPLKENDLANRLGVSRATVREAMRILDTEGLIESVPYHGTSVRQLTKTDIEELYSLRITLETFAIKRIIEQNNPENLERLQQIYAEMLEAGENNNLQQINEIDRDFHDTLIEMSNHSLLWSMWQMVAMRVRQVMALRNMRNTDIRQIAMNHLPILEAIEEQNVVKAVSLLEQHIASAGDLLAEDWQDTGDKESL